RETRRERKTIPQTSGLPLSKRLIAASSPRQRSSIAVHPFYCVGSRGGYAWSGRTLPNCATGTARRERVRRQGGVVSPVVVRANAERPKWGRLLQQPTLP